MYDNECYAIVSALEHWSHYFLSNDFILFIDYETVRFLNSQSKLKGIYASCVEFLSSFHYVLKHKIGSLNKVANALSRRHLSSLCSLQ